MKVFAFSVNITHSYFNKMAADEVVKLISNKLVYNIAFNSSLRSAENNYCL